MNYIEQEMRRVIEDFVEELRSRGESEEAELIEAGEYSSDIALLELMPRLVEIEERLDLQNQVLRKLEAKRDIAMATGSGNAEVGKIQKAIAEVQIGDFSGALSKKFKKEIEDKTRREKQNELKAKSSADVNEIISKLNYWMAGSGRNVFYFQRDEYDQFGNRVWDWKDKEGIKNNHAACSKYIPGSATEGIEAFDGFREFTTALVNQNRVFYEVTNSFRKDLPPGTLNIQNQNFCPPAEDESTDYHWMFDAIYESVSGCPVGSEGFESLRKTIFAKYLHPENYLLPSSWFNDEGASAKSLLAGTHLTVLFSGAVCRMSVEDFTGNFNGAAAGNVILFFNEVVRDRVDVDKIKSFIGEETYPVKNKFERTYMSDNIALVIAACNRKSGGITLAGDKTDRRYSIYSSKTTIWEVVRRYLKVREGIELPPSKNPKVDEPADLWVKQTGQHYLRSAEQNGKWINAMKQRYGDIREVAAYHGSEYLDMQKHQRGAWLETVENIFTDSNFEYIRCELLEELIIEYHKGKNEKLPGPRGMSEAIEKLIKDEGLNVEKVQRCTIKLPQTKMGGKVVQSKSSIQRPVWKIKGTGNTVIDDEKEYGTTDSNGRWVWSWK